MARPASVPQRLVSGGTTPTRSWMKVKNLSMRFCVETLVSDQLSALTLPVLFSEKPVSVSENISWRQLSIGWHHKQLFAYEAAFGSVQNVVQDRLATLHHRSIKFEDFQRPDRVGGSLSSTFKLSGLVEIANFYS